MTSQRKRKRTSSSSTAPCPPSSSYVDDPEIKYDVFLSFRGTDVRSGFLSHLLEELSRKKIDYFVDDQKLEQGNEISSTLLGAIKKYEISLVLFSEDYASSKWCLEELEQIIQCMENQKQIVIPIFYKVDPSTVRHQKGCYRNAFDKLGERFKNYRLQKWRTALKKASGLSGFHSSAYKNEATLIKEVVERVSTVLNETRHQNDLEGFVGIHEHIEYLEARLCTLSQDIFIIGIWGMGGVGKTTIAEILYNRLCYKFEGSHFLRVREGLDKQGSIVQLKRNLLSELLEEDLQHVMLHNIPTYVKRRLCRKKVFIVLDDINKSDQLKILTGGHEWFGSGSRIIMTSRDRHVFSNECDEIYPVEPLKFEESFQLFENALTKGCLIEKQERYELSKKVVNYAHGVPLAINVLAGFLYDKNKDEWNSKLEKLEKMPHSDIQTVLEWSYNGLDDDEHKDIFLYLACFFKNELKERITLLLDACGYHTIDGLRVLRDKALINICCRGYISMHDLIQDMGHEIVRKRSPKELGQRNHLWDADDIYKVFENKWGTRTIESIHFKIWRLKKNLQLGPQAFAGMDNLRLLHFANEHRRNNRYTVYPPKEGFESLPSELRSFYWEGCPLKSFPLRSCVDNLVKLRFTRSKLQRLWDGVQELGNLKVIDLSYSTELIELPDLSKAPNLELVNLIGCEKLSYVSLDSTRLQKRMEISSGSEDSLTSLSTEESEEDDHLNLCGTSLPIKPSVKYYVFPSLQFLYLGNCMSLTELPDDFGLCIPSLEALKLWDCKLETLPTSIKHLSKLTYLNIGGSRWLRSIPELPPSIEYFDASGCVSLETLQFTLNSMPPSDQRHELCIHLDNCVKLSEQTLEAIAMHYKLTINQRVISTTREDSCAKLYFPGSKVPGCFIRYGATQNSVSIPLKLPLCSKPMGFIFYFVLLQNNTSVWFNSEIKCNIKLSNVAKEQFISDGPNQATMLYVSNHVLLWYENSLTLKIMDAVSRIRASITNDITTDDMYLKVWFKLLRTKFHLPGSVKEWGVYPICISSEPQDLANIEKCPDINDSDEDDNDDSDDKYDEDDDDEYNDGDGDDDKYKNDGDEDKSDDSGDDNGI